jgi:hypothetical protein
MEMIENRQKKGMIQILGLSGNSTDLPDASTTGFPGPSGLWLLSNGR